MTGEWDPETQNWLAWARTPGFDAYWYYRDAFFDKILAETGVRTLEVGCGEGRVARDLVARGYQVTAIDTVTGLVRHARDSDPRSSYIVAGGGQLPFRSGSFDQVVAYNVLQVVPDMAAAVRESARVLGAGGHFCFSVSHPVTDLGDWTNGDDPRLLVRSGYFESARVEDTVKQDGLQMTFRGWTHSLQDYAQALNDAGLVIEVIDEPRPDRHSRWGRWTQVPLFMNVRALKPS
jgi:ubiquinone/menaquinone biosynthesis C-methylase UbiE